jgi:hypothetical protein
MQLTIEAFRELFIDPFASHQWASPRGRSHWVELEGWQDSLAGPLMSIIETGGCEYVYPREDLYFAGVNDPPRLLERLLESHSSLAAGVERFNAVTVNETEDLAFMRSLVGQMLELVEHACIVEQTRWDATKPT